MTLEPPQISGAQPKETLYFPFTAVVLQFQLKTEILDLEVEPRTKRPNHVIVRRHPVCAAVIVEEACFLLAVADHQL